jgi:mRNA interferase RelE/StbE
MSFSLQFDRGVKKDLKKLSKDIQAFILDSLEVFVSNFSEKYEKELLKTEKIKVLKGELNDFYRLKLRTYRVIYKKENEKLIIYIIRIAHRKEVYK